MTYKITVEVQRLDKRKRHHETYVADSEKEAIEDCEKDFKKRLEFTGEQYQIIDVQASLY